MGVALVSGVGVGNGLGGEDDEFGCRNRGSEGEGHVQGSQGGQFQGQVQVWLVGRRTLIVAEAQAKREVCANSEELK